MSSESAITGVIFPLRAMECTSLHVTAFLCLMDGEKFVTYRVYFVEDSNLKISN